MSDLVDDEYLMETVMQSGEMLELLDRTPRVFGRKALDPDRVVDICERAARLAGEVNELRYVVECLAQRLVMLEGVQ